jgi:hypothetical protein
MPGGIHKRREETGCDKRGPQYVARSIPPRNHGDGHAPPTLRPRCDSLPEGPGNRRGFPGIRWSAGGAAPRQNSGSPRMGTAGRGPGAAPRKDPDGVGAQRPARGAAPKTAAAGLTFSEKRVYSPSSLRALCCIERRFRQILSEDALPNLVPAEGCQAPFGALTYKAALLFRSYGGVRAHHSRQLDTARCRGQRAGYAAPPPAGPSALSGARPRHPTRRRGPHSDHPARCLTGPAKAATLAGRAIAGAASTRGFRP